MWRFLKKLQIELSYDPAIPLLDIHTEETRIERDTCTPVFIAALFIIARTWKQPRCPSADEWIRKLWYIYTMVFSWKWKESEVTQSCQTFCDHMDTGFSVHGIFQARILEWFAISFSRDLPEPRIEPSLLHCRQTLHHLSHREAWCFHQLYQMNKLSILHSLVVGSS